MIEATNLLCRPITCQRHMGIQKHDADTVIQRTIKKIYHAVSPAMRFHSPGESAKKDFLFNSNLFLHALFPTYRVDLLARCITQKGITQQWRRERSERLSHGGNTAGKICDASVRWHTKNPQVCQLLTTITVSVMTPAHRVNFLPSDLFTSAFFISACCQRIAYSQNCASWNITNGSSHFLQRGKKTQNISPKWVLNLVMFVPSARSCVSFCQTAHK